MIGRVAVSDRELADVVAAGEAELLELLRRLVEAPTKLGNEEPGQDVPPAGSGGLEPPPDSLAYAHGSGTRIRTVCFAEASAA